MKIYFDNAATTPPLLYSAENFLANPSSPHTLGIATEQKLTVARESIAKILSCNSSEIIFTSGGTESNNLAIIGFALANRRKDIRIVTQPWEHPSILEPLKFIQEHKLATVQISHSENWHLCESQLTMAAISQVHHETGDIADISAFAEKLKQNNPRNIILADGVQGFCKEEASLANIDMYTFSGHKCHGQTGVGGLVVQNKTRLVPLMYGGGQENKLRPGTENTHGILHMASAAAELFSYKKEHHTQVTEIKTKLLELTQLSGVTVNALNNNVSPYILNMSFLGVKGEVLVHLLAEKGLYVSMGAACRSRKNTKTALETMGFTKDIANSAIRFSFSHLNTMEEAIAAKEIIIHCVTQLRQML